MVFFITSCYQLEKKVSLTDLVFASKIFMFSSFGFYVCPRVTYMCFCTVISAVVEISQLQGLVVMFMQVLLNCCS